MNDLEVYLKETNNGVEDSAQFWMNVWKLKSIEEFKQLIDLTRIEIFKNTNEVYMNTVKENTIDFDWECNFLNSSKKEYGELIKFFDGYNLDNDASKRIIKFLENEFN
jgi:hypothetical protein